MTDTDWRSLEQFSFGDSPALADELAELALAGKKRATCWAASEGPKTEAGKRWVVLDGSGGPVAVIETVELTQRRFDEVDEAFAFDEGEDTRTLSSWRKAHRNYFERQGRMRRTCCSIASAFGWSRASRLILRRAMLRPAMAARFSLLSGGIFEFSFGAVPQS